MVSSAATSHEIFIFLAWRVFGRLSFGHRLRESDFCSSLPAGTNVIFLVKESCRLRLDKGWSTSHDRDASRITLTLAIFITIILVTGADTLSTNRGEKVHLYIII